MAIQIVRSDWIWKPFFSWHLKLFNLLLSNTECKYAYASAYCIRWSEVWHIWTTTHCYGCEQFVLSSMKIWRCVEKTGWFRFCHSSYSPLTPPLPSPPPLLTIFCRAVSEVNLLLIIISDAGSFFIILFINNTDSPLTLPYSRNDKNTNTANKKKTNMWIAREFRKKAKWIIWKWLH